MHHAAPTATTTETCSSCQGHGERHVDDAYTGEIWIGCVNCDGKGFEPTPCRVCGGAGYGSACEDWPERDCEACNGTGLEDDAPAEAYDDEYACRLARAMATTLPAPASLRGAS